MARSILDSLFGPALLRYLGVDLPQRSVIDFEGAGVSVADDPTTKATKVTIGSTATTPTGDGFRRVVGGIEQAAAALVNLASDVTGTLAAARGGTGLNAGAIASNPSKALITRADGTGIELATLLDLSTGLAGQFLVSNGLGGAAWTDAVANDAAPNGFRLTLTTATPVTSTDVTGASTLYWTPFRSDAIALFDGTLWRVYRSGEISLVLAGLTPGLNYDVFAYWTGSAVALELVAWATATSRATAIARQNGIRCKAGQLTRRLVGTIRTTSASTTEDSYLKRFVCNADNQVPRVLWSKETTGTWAGGTAGVWRQVRATATNRFEFVSGDVGYLLEVDAAGMANASGGGTFASGVGIDSTATNSAQIACSYTTGATPTRAKYIGSPGLGYHAINALEYTNAASTTFYGNADPPACAMLGRIAA